VSPQVRLGLRENLPQFSLLVLINVFVGVMIGLERTVVPLIGEQEFGLTSKTAIVSFIVSFGVTKALANLAASRISERWGRKKVLVLGWLFGLPVPFLIIWADAWWWFDRDHESGPGRSRTERLGPRSLSVKCEL